MEFRVLGSLEVRDQGAALALGGARQRSVLAALLLRPGQTASIGYLADAVWETPPASPASNLRTYVAGLRQCLGADRLTTRSGGYALEVRPGELDLTEFVALSGAGDDALRSGDLGAAAGAYARALALWRGTALEGQPIGAGLRPEVTRLDEERLVVAERYADARLGLGQHTDLVGELRRLVADHPLRERLWEQLMTALHRSGMRAEALHSYQQLYRLLDTELGVAPGQSLRDLHAALLADEPARAVPAVQPDRVPRQLPPEADHYTDRDEALAELSTLVTLSAVLPVVTVTGKPGVGKTAFAIRAGHRLAAAFPDGQLFVDLRGADTRPRSSDDVLARFLRDLGVPGVDVPSSGEERTMMFRDLLADRKMLVVLDNAASEQQVRPLLPGHPGCCVVVTSRSRLSGLDTTKRLALQALGPVDAVRLLDRLADAAGDPQVRRIAELCGGLPLALRIIGTKLRSLPNLTADVLATRLHDEQHRLDEMVAGDREVRASFLLSYSGLDDALRRTFRLLALLPGRTFPSWAVAAALGVDLRTAERLLDRLVEANLLECAGRYRFHDLLRLFAQEKAAQDSSEEERAEAERRVAGAYLHFAQLADGLLEFGGLPRFDAPAPDFDAADVVDALSADPAAWLDGERHCLTELVERAVRDGRDEQACQLVATLGAYCELRARWDDMVMLMTLALGAARRHNSAYWQAYALFGWGIASREQREFVVAEERFRECFAVLPDAGDPLLDVVVRLSVGVGHRLRGRFPEAVVAFADCMTRLAALDAPRWLGYTKRELGVLHRYQQRWAEAEVCLSQAVELFGGLGNRRWRAASLRDLAIARRDQGDPVTALTMLTECREVFADVRDRRREAATWRSLAYAHLALGALDQALSCALRSREIFAFTLDDHGTACTVVCLGEVHLALGRHDEALALLRDGVALFERLGDVRWHARALRGVEHGSAQVGLVQ
ncbi:AfsR/SARP family transcriptional regulator [Lentzea flaviverrucosa]|uniref:DNA-binding transcriptional activator of the SARP family n=1 Tax=Lentzea flaviverrucosa TaxID=200379 RepID=A0A1H9XT56_9PSEU|nr:AfsR/SARP family transcriptional regulator [Lentzea flaviverrucosa]RDI19259.1 DNA-binding SARP family transcriptional activator [Lentzea flaviverrucosa]SES49229.1 DNA-binding transcriptional activator of the SARP family [Lentzea flaviverrucosa]